MWVGWSEGFLSCFTVSRSPCEKLMGKGGLSVGSSASLPPQTGSRDGLPALNTKILYPSKCLGPHPSVGLLPPHAGLSCGLGTGSAWIQQGYCPRELTGPQTGKCHFGISVTVGECWCSSGALGKVVFKCLLVLGSAAQCACFCSVITGCW